MTSLKSEARVKKEDGRKSTYLYPPLSDPSYIRLIKLYPLTPEDGSRENRANILSPTRVDLIRTPLQEAPSFTALSYTWGTSTTQVELLVGDGAYVHVSQNAYDILQRLRPEAEDAPNYFWMDQLCINQNDDDEKWQQIRIMRHIYGKATGTFVVLAGCSDTFDPLLLQLGMISLPLLHSPPHFTRDGEGPIALLQVHSSEELPEIIRKLFADKVFRGHMKNILENPVFRRVWIYQEIVSSKSVYLLGSKIRLAWNVFARAFKIFIRLEAEASNRNTKSAYIASLELIFEDRNIRQSAGHKDWMLLHTEAQGLLKATDPRDNTIALTTFEDFYTRIPPYRDLTIAMLYLKFTRTMITASKTLDVFAALPGGWHLPQRELENMPSWVPDWSRERDSIPLYWPQKQTSFNAAKGYCWTFCEIFRNKEAEREVLVVRGKKIDTIKLESEYKFEDYRHEENLVKILRVQEHCVQWLAHTESRGCPMIKGERTYENCKPFSRAMIAAMTASFTSYASFINVNFLNSPQEEIYDELVFILAWYDEHMAGETLYHEGRPHVLSFMPRTYGSWKAGITQLRQWSSICFGRRIAYGETQDFGLVPSTAQYGDIICILHGSRVPIVLRRLGRCYRVIGQCYWHGWMYGEKVNWKEDEGDHFSLV